MTRAFPVTHYVEIARCPRFPGPERSSRWFLFARAGQFRSMPFVSGSLRSKALDKTGDMKCFGSSF